LYAVPTWPLGKDVVVMTSVGAAIVSESETVLLWTGLLESLTLKVSGVALTAAVGVPLMAPVEVFSDSPAGNVPLVSDQLYGVAPPVAFRLALYAVPTWPFGNDVVVMASGAAIVSESDTDLLWTGLLESLTLKVSEVALTAAVGVPLMAPVAAFRDSPVGNVPLVSDQLYGVVPPVAFRLAL
jgi:hypothetical protein